MASARSGTGDAEGAKEGVRPRAPRPKAADQSARRPPSRDIIGASFPFLGRLGEGNFLGGEVPRGYFGAV